ncbi:hypothetical protein LTR10_016495 [Elasticomyces elasticus]|nr:hypothetical protein LTR10_016495 [Elasticomyces elasticus]KAK5022001.1 hypothetical protein LTS07_010416 [Exophiala sideris]KAK5177236.1 hypothetical protein LTR44_010197 [Eurotiomycetes sp. CCFEE 6388]
MSNQPFSFPPPPPPPPKRAADNSYGQNNGFPTHRGSSRGGGFGRGGGRGGRGSQRGSHHAPHMGHNNYANRPNGDNWNRNTGLNPPQKRDHTSAFNNAQPTRPRPTAAPAVPSFNASIEHLLPRKPAALNVEKPKKQNLLGLTPTNADPDSEPEDDEGEETRLATQTKSAGHGLEIAYKGHVSTLRTPAEIAAWIAERKARFPTAVKVEAAKKEAAEKKRKWEEEKAARLEANRQARIKRDEERKQQIIAREQTAKAQKELEARKHERLAKSKDVDLDAATIAEMKAEKLRKKALKAEQRLAKAEEALRVAQEKPNALAASQTKDQPPEDATSDHEQPSQLEDLDVALDADIADPDATSSSGTSTTDSGSDSSEAGPDSDSAPEVMSTKQAALVHDLAPQPPKAAQTATPRLCNSFVKTGRCKFGARCRFMHDTSRGKKTSTNAASSSLTANTRRKGLWEVMVQKEKEEEHKRLLEAIIMLGLTGIPNNGAPLLHALLEFEVLDVDAGAF